MNHIPLRKKKCLEFKVNENVAIVHSFVCGISHFLLQSAASPEDTPELSAFLRNSTIPHLVRKRDVPVVEFHRQSPAKILVSYASAHRTEGNEWIG